MITTTVFKSNKTQAVRLPKEVAFGDDVTQVRVIKKGKSRVITPVGMAWEEFFNSLETGNDFLLDRNQPGHQKRDLFDD